LPASRPRCLDSSVPLETGSGIVGRLLSKGTGKRYPTRRGRYFVTPIFKPVGWSLVALAAFVRVADDPPGATSRTVSWELRAFA